MLHPNRPHHRPRLVALGAAALAALAAFAAAGSSVAGGNPSPTCLNGYVWRVATPADLVCVTPAVRLQTARENAEAAARRSPTGGAYGPATCLPGFVWREAAPSDLVCVEPWVRDQARGDTLRAPARRNEVRIAVDTYRPATQTCSGGVCRTTSDNAARYRVWVDRLNVGGAVVILVDAWKGRTVRVWRQAAGPNPAAPGGLLSLPTGELQCQARPNVLPNGYFRVQDTVSGIWSQRSPVWIGCKTL